MTKTGYKKALAGAVFSGIFLIAGLLLFLRAGQDQEEEIQISKLMVCRLENPLGLDEPLPTFSWQMQGGGRGSAQSAYRILVAESEEALAEGRLVWDSGKTESGDSVGICCEGLDLKAKQRYFWTVQVWDEKEKAYEALETAWFETGLLGEGMSGARWISAPEEESVQTYSEGDCRYSISYRMEVENTSAGFVFGAAEGRYGAMYVCRLTHTDEKTSFAVMRMENNQFVSEQEMDLSGCRTEDNRTFDVELSVEYDQLTVKVNKTEAGTAQIEPTPVGSIGYYKDRGVSYAWIDDIRICDAGGEVILEERFEGAEHIFSPYYAVVEDGRLKAGSGLLLTKGAEHPAPVFRREFSIPEKEIQSARIYMTALGSFQITVNARQVSDHYFDPGKLAYNSELSYVTYDVTDMLEAGADNALGITLLHGWYDRGVGYTGIWNPWGDTNALLGKLEIHYNDGSRDVIVTDERFQCFQNGPVRENDLYQGEYYDPAYEVPGFDEAGFQGEGWLWAAADRVKADYYEIPLTARENEPIRCVEILRPVSVSEPEENVFVYDFGQNFAGTCRIRVKGEKGQVIVMRYGEEINREEMINRDDTPGTVWTENLLTAEATDYYVLSGNPQGETFEPEFVFHGFRYLQITGLEEALPCEAVEGMVLSSDLEQTGSFECSSRLLNQYFHNTCWSQRSNFMDNPMDCPQRDERHGWAGDAQIFSLTASYNMNVYAFYRKYLKEARSIQNEGGSFADMIPRNFGTQWGGEGGAASNNCWGDAPVVITWNLYCQYGERRILEENYEDLCRWVQVLVDTSDDYVRYWGGYGDHLALEGTPVELSDTAWCARSAQLLSKMAQVLGKEEDSVYYRQIYEKFREAWQKKFVLPNGQTVCNTQTSYAVGLGFSLFPQELESAAAAYLNELMQQNGYQIKTGFSGIGYLLPALSEHGYTQSAYEALLQEESPGLLFAAKHGATTNWEQLQGYREEDNGYVLDGSLNHCAFGAPASWIYTDILGIQADEANPGYKHFFLEPEIGGGLTYAQGSYTGAYGRISVKWEKAENGYQYEFEIPANTTATLLLPVSETGEYMESGKPADQAEGVRQLEAAEGKQKFELLSGKYMFHIKEE